MLRLLSVFGPAQRRLLVWEIFEQLVGPADEVVLQATGHETREFLHVDDVGEAVLRTLERSLLRNAPSGRAEIVNVGSGEEVGVLELAELVKSLVGTSKPIICRGVERPGDPRHWRADVSRFAEVVAPWRPRSPRRSLASCIAAWKSDSA